MVRTLSHRGPDDMATWADPHEQVAIAHTRLAILDLSPAGSQPMQSSSGRYVLSYNGEIYNHLELREQLQSGSLDRRWNGHSDTETLLAAIEAWGVAESLKHAQGMFAFALWDRRLKKLILARDRFGEKPVYYGWQGEGKHRAFLFGSELKALRRHPSFENVICRAAVGQLLKFLFVPGPLSIYEGIYKLQPGHYLSLSAAEGVLQTKRYWSASGCGLMAREHAQPPSEHQAAEDVDKLLYASVKRQMISDVPLGAFLSGGVDSTCIVAMMQSLSTNPVKTFSIGFEDENYDEAPKAREAAARLGTDHNELYVHGDDALRTIPSLPLVYDEPFGDPSQIPTYLLAAQTRQHVKVALSGDGGDELFGGYGRYEDADRYWKFISRIPWKARSWLLRSVEYLEQRNTFDLTQQKPARPDPATNTLGRRFSKAVRLLDSRDQLDLYTGVLAQHRRVEALFLGEDGNPDWEVSGGSSDPGRFSLVDVQGYLPDNILVKVDRAAMYVSLETRAPFLDERLASYAFALPWHLKSRGGITKRPLRLVLQKYLPGYSTAGAKRGFGVPLGSWLRGPLKAWAEDLLTESKLRRGGFFKVSAVRKLWGSHLSGERDASMQLWGVLVFQAWYETTHAGSGLRPERNEHA